jgi:tRNA(Ile)-lysidine synthase
MKMAELGPFEPNPCIAVAVSGGADSLALVLLAKNWTDSIAGRVVALTVDHRLRDESHDEAVYVQRLLEERSIEHHILVWEHGGDKVSSNISARAREKRYELLTNWCLDNSVLHLLVGHHRDDQIENFLIRAERGSGLNGLSAMSLISYLAGTRVLRPLMDCNKESLRKYIYSQGVMSVEDPTNYNQKYKRSAIRKLLDNEGALTRDRLYETSRYLARARTAIEQLVVDCAVTSVRVSSYGYALVIWSKFMNYAEEVRLRTLSSLLMVISGRAHAVRFASLLHAVKHMSSSHKCTLGGCVVEFYRGDFLIYRERGAAKEQSFSGIGTVIWDNRFTITSMGSESSLTISVLSQHSWSQIRKKLAEPDIPGEVLFTLPQITSRGELLAIPHLGYNNLAHQPRCCFTPRHRLLSNYCKTSYEN